MISYKNILFIRAKSPIQDKWIDLFNLKNMTK